MPAERRARLAIMKSGFIVIFVIGTGLLEAQEPVRLTDHPAEDRAPAWSPDGARLLFDSDRDGTQRIYVVDEDGASLACLTWNENAAQYPAWSPDGERIAFQSRGGLWVKDLATGNETKILEDASAELTPDWSPDGRFIAFAARAREGAAADIYLAPAPTRERSGNPPSR